MKIISQQLIALTPFLVIGMTVMVVMLSIVWKRNHLISAILSILGLSIALFSLYFINKIKIINITDLLVIDKYSIFYTILILISSIIICLFSYIWLENLFKNKEEFYLLILISTIGGITLVNINNLVTLFLGIELISLPLFGLIGYVFYQKKSLEASIKYTILSITASSFLLLGIAILYAQSGSFSFLALSKIYSKNIQQEPMILSGLTLLMVGIFFKLSLVPFHLWTPDVYQGSPIPATIFLTTVNKVAIFSALMRILLYTSLINNYFIHLIITITAFASIFLGNLMALRQRNIKRLLGYSSVSQLGYLLIILSFILKNKQVSIEAITIYLLNYLISNIGIFGVIILKSYLYKDNDSDLISSYRGLFWNNPILSLSITIMILSLIGIPITLGFISKLYLFTIIIQIKPWWIAIIMVISYIISLYYYLRIIINLYLNVSENNIKFNINKLFNWKYRMCEIILNTLGILIIVFGIYPQFIINIIQNNILN